MNLLVGVVATVAGAAMGQTSVYQGHHMVLVTASTPEQLAALDELGINLACRQGLGVQQMIVAPENLAALDALNLPVVTVSENAQAMIDAERAEITQLHADRSAAFYTTYRTLAEISTLVDDLVTLAPNVATRFTLAPNSIQGNTLFGIKITGPGGGPKPKVVINGCQHAREWVSPMSVCYAAEQLALGYGVDSQITELLDAVEVHIIPISNPDGFLYTWSTDRYWRKNRRSNGGGTFGVDLNRNWSYQWGGASTSSSGSSDVYKGTAPFSEPETQALRNYMNTLAGTVTCLSEPCAAGYKCADLRAHLDIHTFAALVLGPWGYSLTVPPPKEPLVRNVQTEMEDALVGSSGYPYIAGLGVDDLLYAAAGIAPDWTFEQFGSLAWTYELRPNSGGLEGFSPPSNQILPAAQETFAGILALLERVAHPSVDTEWTNLPAFVATAGQAEVRISTTYDECATAPTGTIFWRPVGGGAFTSGPMVRQGADFTAQLAASACGSSIEYYAELSVPGSPNLTRVPATPGTYRTLTTNSETVVFNDTFANNLGWTVTNSGGLTDGAWVRGVPVSPAPVGAPSVDADGSTWCYVTDNTAGSASDVDGSSTTLTSPAMDATDPNTYIEYARWYHTRGGAAPNADSLVVQVSDNNGSTWKALETVGPAGPENNGGWIRRSFKVATIPTMTNTSQFRIRFVASDASPASNVEAGVDAVRLLSYFCAPPPPACDGDVDGDGDTNVSDFNILASHFGQTVPNGTNGDLTGDGVVDVADFNILAGDFGCEAGL